MVGGLAKKVIAADFGFGEKNGIGDNRSIHQMVAMTDDELHHAGLIAFRKPVAPQPALLEMRRVDHERIAHKPASLESLISVGSVGGRMRTSVHPDGAEPLGGLGPNMNGDQLHGMRVPVFPNAEVSHGAHLIGRHVAIALMVLEGQTRWVVGKGPQSSRFVDREPGIIADLGPRSALETILVHCRRPITGKVNRGGWPVRCRRWRRALREQADLGDECRQ